MNFDFLNNDFLSDILIQVFERHNNKAATDKEKQQIQDFVRGWNIDSSNRVKDDPLDLDAETKSILRQDKIEEFAHSIRIVVVCSVNLLKDPTSYNINRYIVDIKEHHLKLLNILDDEIYPEVVSYAENDMFYGEFRLLGDSAPYKSFFTEYTRNPRRFILEANNAV